MAHFCLNRFAAVLKSLRNLPMAQLQELLPPGTPMQPKASTLAQHSAFSLNRQKMGRLNMSNMMNFGVGMPQIPEPILPPLEAMANLSPDDLKQTKDPKGMMGLQRQSGAFAMQMPNLLAPLGPLLAPLQDMLSDMLAAMQTKAAVAEAYGVDLGQPGAVPAFRAAFTTPKIDAQLRNEMSMLAQLGPAARAANATDAMGMSLSKSGMGLKLANRLSMMANVQMPRVVFSPESRQALAAVQTLSAINKAAGLNILLPKGLSMMKMMMANLLENLEGIDFAEAMDDETLAAANDMQQAAPAMTRSFPKIRRPEINALLTAKIPQIEAMGLQAQVAGDLETISGESMTARGSCQMCNIG
ncbi:MAG: hypothetical protein AAGI17_02215 [Planctomycetota bacterium]